MERGGDEEKKKRKNSHLQMAKNLGGRNRERIKKRKKNEKKEEKKWVYACTCVLCICMLGMGNDGMVVGIEGIGKSHGPSRVTRV